jgi:hypothetical protein
MLRREKSRRLAAAIVMMGLLLAAIAGCSRKGGGPMAPPVQETRPVLVLEDGRTEDSVAVILGQAGIPYVLGGPYWAHDGAGLDRYSAVVLLMGWEYNRTMADSAQQKIVAYVAGGGALVTTEWLLFNVDTVAGDGPQEIVAAITPGRYGGGYDYAPETYTIQQAGHAIAQGLPASFTTPAEWSYSVVVPDAAAGKEPTVVIAGSGSGAAVIAGRHGLGRTVHWSMGGQYEGDAIWSAEVRRLLVNIVRYASRRT